MITLEIEDTATPYLASLQKQLPYIAATTLNNVAFDVQKRQRERMAKVFDRPTPLVTRAWAVKKAKKTHLTAEVGATERRQRVLQTHERGLKGRPRSKLGKYLRGKNILMRGWYAVPVGNYRTDRYGNPSKAVTNRLIKDMEAGAFELKNSHFKPGIYRIIATGRKNKSVLFYVRYKRKSGPATAEQTKRGKRNKVLMLYSFKNDLQYKPRLDFTKTALADVQKALPNAMAQAIDRAIKTTRR